MISTILMDSLWTSGWTPNRTCRQNQAGCPIADQQAARKVGREQRLRIDAEAASRLRTEFEQDTLVWASANAVAGLLLLR
jgi:hypothetical protein